MLGNLIGWCFFGLVAGCIAKWLTGSRNPPGCLATIAIGVAGSFTVGAIFHVLFARSNEGIQPAGFIGSIIGAVIVLLVLRSLRAPPEE